MWLNARWLNFCMRFPIMLIPTCDSSDINYDVMLLEALLANASLTVVLNCGFYT